MSAIKWSLSDAQWKYVETEFMKKNYKELAGELGVDWHWLRHAAVKRGLKRGRWGRMGWTNEEKSILREAYPKLPRQEVLKLLPNRNWMGVLHMAQRLGLRHSLLVEFRDQLQLLRLTPAEAGYIAGIVDGEGSVFLLKVKNPQPKRIWHKGKTGRIPRKRTKEFLVSGVMACNTDLKMIRFIQERCGGVLTSRPITRQTREKRLAKGLRSHSPLHVLNVRGCRALRMLQAISPYMITKKAAAEVVERYLLLRLSKEKNSRIGEEEFALYAEWRLLCPRKGSRAWAKRYSI